MKRKTVIILGGCLIAILCELSKPGQLQFDAPFVRELFTITSQARPSAKKLALRSAEILEDRNFGLSEEQINSRDLAKTDLKKCSILKFSKLDASTVLANIRNHTKTTIEQYLGSSDCSENGYQIYKSGDFEIRVKYNSEGEIIDYEPKTSAI